jgi:leucyl-tRNA synthetase
VEGAFRFLKRLWRLMTTHVNEHGLVKVNLSSLALNEKQKDLRRHTHETILKVTDDLKRRYTFNTAIAAVMELVNATSLYMVEEEADKHVKQEALEAIILMLSPIVPHITHELWHSFGKQEAVLDATWPSVDETALVKDTISIVVQVNGKVRANMDMSASSTEEMIKENALNHENIQRHLDGKTVRKVIVVGQKLVNIVAN